MRRFGVLAYVVPLLSAVGASAQGDPSVSNDPAMNRGLEPAPRVVTASPNEPPSRSLEPNAPWGSQLGAIFISATQFTPKLLPSSPDLVYSGNFFFSGDGRYYAQITVDPGDRIDHFACVFNDPDATDEVRFTWFRYITNVDTGISTSLTMDSFITGGAPGIGYEFLDPQPGQDTMHVYNPPFELINHHLAVDVSPTVGFAGCWAFHARQVAPAPAVATFTDVPTGHPFFRFVEALVATGVTAGCGSGSFCVNNPITRGEMAVFLAVALGVGIQY